MTSRRRYLHDGLLEPESVTALTLPEWDLLIRDARGEGLLAKMFVALENAGILDRVPTQAKNHLVAAATVAKSQNEVVLWEAHCIRRALNPVQRDIILLKGAAYVLAGLPVAHGRLFSDVDILVPKSNIKAVEASLLQHGWVGMKLEKYDQRFYRNWSHELPPLMHSERETTLDVHHNILPQTGRLHPPGEKLLERSLEIPGTPYRRLCDVDMVLHAAVHLFQDGDFDRTLRELTDIEGLLQAFGSNPAFWDDLLGRTTEMSLTRPMFYALRYCHLHLKAPVPAGVLKQSAAWGPARPVLMIMDALVELALQPKHARTRLSGAARWLLYVRSHWLRMPPVMLARHLTHQAIRRLFPG